MDTNNNSGINQPAPEPKKSVVGKLWVVVVLLAGLVVGVLLSEVATLPNESRIFFLRRFFPVFNPDPSIRLHIILTTLKVALMLALVAVYLKVYFETKANFSLGLVAVLVALLLQTVFSYPLLLGTSGAILVPGLLTTLADFLAVAAYTIFLYLSLE